MVVVVVVAVVVVRGFEEEEEEGREGLSFVVLVDGSDVDDVAAGSISLFLPFLSVIITLGLEEKNKRGKAKKANYLDPRRSSPSLHLPSLRSPSSPPSLHSLPSLHSR